MPSNAPSDTGSVPVSAELFAPVSPGLELCYQTFGTPDGDPLVLVMGLGGPMTWWDPELCTQLAEAGFLGIGIDPGTPSWGSMISDAVGVFDIAWWFMTFPGLALVLTVLAFNLVGDGLQDALNPRTAK